MKRITLSLLILSLTAGSAFSQFLNLPKGKTFEITTHITDKGTYKSNELNTYSFRSLGKDVNGNFMLETRIVKSKINDSETQERQLNTDSIRKTELNSTGPLFSLAMLNKPFKVIVSPQGKLIAVEGVMEILSSELKSWVIKPEIQQNIFDNAKSFDQTIAGLFYKADANKSSISTEQKPQNADAPFTLTNKSTSTVTMQSSKVTAQSKEHTKYVIDLNSGLVNNALKTTESIVDNSPLPFAAKKVNISSSIKQSLGVGQRRKAIDTAWINYAVKLSYWSDAYKKGAEYDSAKVYQLLKVKDHGILSDRYFAIRRLNAVQALHSDRSYEVYDSLLIKTPNAFLKGDYSHLHNKLGTSLEKLGPDSAYEVSKYAIETDAFNQWIQHSFSQAFNVSQDDINKKGERLTKSYKLLDLFKGNKGTKYQQMTTGLYLWANALRNPADTLGLITAGNSFSQMSDENMKAGNGGRYSLLIYQRLLEAKQDAEASKLLDATIQKLERYASDTLNKERYAHQNMLAGAYYLKSIAASASGDPEHVTYLAKAAKYSPTSPKEKAHSSFYDRVFLKTKESYKEEYMERMLSSGNEKEGLKMFIESINAMPENIGEMQKLFKQKFPDKGFKAFFNEEIVNTWLTAPSFVVKGVDGQEYKLRDYKDKWLVIDFWGTWCSPCREEMPIVNKFAVEVAEGKYPNMSFLSVACRDTESKVKEYLAENKFTMTAAMSDGQIEQKFKIPYYPSKILISPEGKMIHIEFGKDWQAVIKSFSTL
jgi:thiol-disulfide isomerase/thioredoxin